MIHSSSQSLSNLSMSSLPVKNYHWGKLLLIQDPLTDACPGLLLHKKINICKWIEPLDDENCVGSFTQTPEIVDFQIPATSGWTRTNLKKQQNSKEKLLQKTLGVFQKFNCCKINPSLKRGYEDWLEQSLMKIYFIITHLPCLKRKKKFFSKRDGIITGYMTAIEKIAELKVAKYSHDLKNADLNISKLR